VDDLKERKADLDKALINTEYDTVIKILRYLSKIEMNKEVLALTLIGKSMTQLSSLTPPGSRGDLESQAKQIRELSASILAEWKKLIAKTPTAAAPETEKKPIKNAEAAKETAIKPR
jgi:hypothetical protein